MYVLYSRIKAGQDTFTFSFEPLTLLLVSWTALGLWKLDNRIADRLSIHFVLQFLYHTPTNHAHLFSSAYRFSGHMLPVSPDGSSCVNSIWNSFSMRFGIIKSCQRTRNNNCFLDSRKVREQLIHQDQTLFWTFFPNTYQIDTNTQTWNRNKTKIWSPIWLAYS